MYTETWDTTWRMIGTDNFLEEFNGTLSWKWEGINNLTWLRIFKSKTKIFQNKYRKAAHMKLASAAGVLGEKIKMDSTFNCLVNDQGKFREAIIIKKS